MAAADKRLAQWRQANPNAKIVHQQKPLSGVVWEGSGQTQTPMPIVSLSIDYED